MGSVAAEHDDSGRAIDDNEALHQHPIGSSRLPDSPWLRSRARFRFGLSSNSLSIELNLPAATFLVGLGRLFRLIFRSFRLDGQDFPRRGVDANLFGIFRSRLGDIHGPEVLPFSGFQFRAPHPASRHLS